jgi:hypothetical protein
MARPGRELLKTSLGGFNCSLTLAGDAPHGKLETARERVGRCMLPAKRLELQIAEAILVQDNQVHWRCCISCASPGVRVVRHDFVQRLRIAALAC